MNLQPVILMSPLEAHLTPPERVARQRQQSRAALRLCALHCGLPATVLWRQDERRVPLPWKGHHWSVSHKPGCAAAVIAQQPVGIDVELIRPRLHEGLLDRLAGEDEWRVAGGRSWELFFQVWTAKEAVLKACGHGISGFGDCRVVVLQPGTLTRLEYESACWQVEHLRRDSCIAAVTSRGDSVIWRVVQSDAQQEAGIIQPGPI